MSIFLRIIKAQCSCIIILLYLKNNFKLQKHSQAQILISWLWWRTMLVFLSNNFSKTRPFLSLHRTAHLSCQRALSGKLISVINKCEVSWHCNDTILGLETLCDKEAAPGNTDAQHAGQVCGSTKKHQQQGSDPCLCCLTYLPGHNCWTMFR